MARIILLISVLGLLYTAPAMPAPSPGGSRTILRVLHARITGGYTCAMHETGKCCRDTTHWSIVVNKHDFDVQKSEEACAAAAAIAAQDPGVVSLEAESDASALVCVDKTTPFIVVQRLTKQLATAGFSRVSVRASDIPPDQIVEVRLRIDFDGNTQVVSRQVDGTPVSDDAGVKKLVETAVRNAKRTHADPAIILTIESSPTVPWEAVATAAATCRVDGVTSVETVVGEYR